MVAAFGLSTTSWARYDRNSLICGPKFAEWLSFGAASVSRAPENVGLEASVKSDATTRRWPFSQFAEVVLQKPFRLYFNKHHSTSRLLPSPTGYRVGPVVLTRKFFNPHDRLSIRYDILRRREAPDLPRTLLLRKREYPSEPCSVGNARYHYGKKKPAFPYSGCYAYNSF